MFLSCSPTPLCARARTCFATPRQQMIAVSDLAPKSLFQLLREPLWALQRDICSHGHIIAKGNDPDSPDSDSDSDCGCSVQNTSSDNATIRMLSRLIPEYAETHKSTPANHFDALLGLTYALHKDNTWLYDNDTGSPVTYWSPASRNWRRHGKTCYQRIMPFCK